MHEYVLHPIPQATPIATTPSHQLPDHLPRSFFARPAELVAPELIECDITRFFEV